MVDDQLMGVTHVFRGEEWISSAPKHVVLIRSLGWTPPVFVHVPVIKGKDGSKLSKRHGDTACLDFRRAGFLGDAMANFIALIGWSPGGDREVMTMDEMAEAFDLKGIQPSPGIFDMEKLTWMNGHYIRQIPPAELASSVHTYASADENLGYWDQRDHSVAEGMRLLSETWQKDRELVASAVALEQERVTQLSEFGRACVFFFVEEVEFDASAVAKWKGQAHVTAMFDAFIAALEGRTSVTVAECEALLRAFQESAGFDKLGPVVHPTRVALTGKTVGPGLFELMAALGPDRMARRLRRAKDVLA
jgi:glutamyl/glutaminyl-tRNA synthetase